MKICRKKIPIIKYEVIIPNQYREKVCPVCDTVHRKRGIHCGQSCANKQRPISDNIRNNMRKVSYDYKLTPEGVAQNKMINGTVFKADEYAVGVPDLRTIDDFDMFENYQLGEKW